MAKATNQSILRGIEGKLGDVVARTVNDKTVVSKAPKRRSKKSAREIINHGLFQQAAAFAVECMRDTDLKIHFKNVAKKRKLPNGYTAALSMKLKALNVAAKDEFQRELNTITYNRVDACERVDSVNDFARVCQHTENIIGDVLYEASAAWRIIERSGLNENQKEVLRSSAHRQIRKWLEFTSRL